jgi:hypothetical protein
VALAPEVHECIAEAANAAETKRCLADVPLPEGR